MKTIYVLRGLPASGKTTRALEMVEKGIKRVSKDDLRAMLHGGKFTVELEVFVLAVRDAIIKEALERDCDIVVDDTNLNPVHFYALVVLEMVPLVRAYYGIAGNESGGVLHLVLDDGNVEDSAVKRCLEQAKENHDERGVALAELLLKLSEEQREQLYLSIWKAM